MDDKQLTSPSSLRDIEDALHVDFSSRYLLSEGIDKCPVPLFVIDREHKVTHWNEALFRLTGQNEAEMLGAQDYWRVFYPFPRPTMADLMVDEAAEAEIDRYYRGKYRRSPLHADGFEFLDFFPLLGENGKWLQFMAAPIRDPSGRVVGAIEALQDVTDQRRAESELLQSQSFLYQVVEGSSVPTFVIDREHRVTHWNRACEAITGVSAQEMIGTRNQWRPFYPQERPVMADLILNNALDKDVEVFYQDKFRTSQLLAGAFEGEDYFPHLGEGGRWLFFTATPIRDAEGNCVGAIETLQDVSAQKNAEVSLRASEERFRVMSITDALTSLYNARYFREQIGIEIRRTERYRHPLSLLVIDLDDFKRLNDTHGHLEGDKVLALVASVIRQCCREVDSAYRYGGEEFVVLLPETEISVAARVAERLRQSICDTTPTTAAGEAFCLTASIGVAAYQHGDGAESLFARADKGVYTAKHAGKNQVAIVDDTPDLSRQCPEDVREDLHGKC